MTLNYPFQKIEKKWQAYWEKNGLNKTPTQVNSSNKYYILPQLPYPSGEGLHVGHTSVYTPCDVYARFKRMQGKKVLQVIGWDSFGLPAENFAVKNNVHPRLRTEQSIANFESQIRALGCSLDWERSTSSHLPSYYKWTQWFFLLLYKKGLAYRKEQSVNWCPGCQTVLADEQTVTGQEDARRICERCETVVEQRSMAQWFFKITAYADRLSQDLDKLDWPAESVKRQKDWIGRSEGAKIKFPILAPQFSSNFIEVFTTRPDTFFGVTFLVLAPDGPFVKEYLAKFPNALEVKEYIVKSSHKTELERQADKSKTGVDTGLKVINPFNHKEVPVFVADFVLGGFGTGAVAGVPGSDERDFEFAFEYNLPIIRVVKGSSGRGGEINSIEEVETDPGVAINSSFLDGLSTREAMKKAIEYAEDNGFGEATVSYRLRDWSISRQRFWGAPIPILYDPQGHPHPVPEDDLPVLLPEDVDFKPTGESPLKYSLDFQNGVEERYGKGWRREVDTLDTFVCSSWYYYRYLDPHNKDAFASPEALKTWMPVDFYLGGREHVNGHLLYSRFFTKVLFDAGLVDFEEPFPRHRHQGTIWGEDNRIMSKRYGNVINPTQVMEEFGADTLRLYHLFLGPLEASKPWNVEGIKGVARFLARVYRLSAQIMAGTVVDRPTCQLANEITPDLEDLRFNVAIAKMMTLLNVYEKTSVSRASFEVFLKILAPFAPHLAEELWEKLGYTTSIHLETWPVFPVMENAEVTVVVQVNGKLRGTLNMPTVQAMVQQEVDEQARNLLGDRWPVEQSQIIFVPGKLINFVVKSK